MRTFFIRLIELLHSRLGLLAVSSLIPLNALLAYLIKAGWRNSAALAPMALFMLIPLACQYAAVVWRQRLCAVIMSLGAATLFGVYWAHTFYYSAHRPGPLLRSWDDAEGWLPIVTTGSWLVIAIVMGLWAYRIEHLEKGLPDPITGLVPVLGKAVLPEDPVNLIDIPPIKPPAWLIAQLCREYRIAKLTLLNYDDTQYERLRDILVEFEQGDIPGLRFFTAQLELEQLLNRPVNLLTEELLRSRSVGHQLLHAKVLWPCEVKYIPPRYTPPRHPKPTVPASALQWLAPIPWVEKPEQSVARPDLPLAPLPEFCRTYHIRRLALVDPAWRRSSISDDVELLAEFEPGHVPGLLFFGLEQELSLLVDRRIDLFTLGFIDPQVRESMRTTARVLYEAA